ncbi:MAG TPA: formate dehydrogenase accessory sulfurtransferase FdhD, partial [Steroidobacteraceae bacterium]
LDQRATRAPRWRIMQASLEDNAMDTLASRAVLISAVGGHAESLRQDPVAVEEPLEIRIARHAETGAGDAVAVTMRTPGYDAELAVGFLFGEGLLRQRSDVTAAEVLATDPNVVLVTLAAGVLVDLGRIKRNFYATSSCGVCGKSAIAAISPVPMRPATGVGELDEAVLLKLPQTLRAAQSEFQLTGGLHGVGLFDRSGSLTLLREDVGRHNAMDKLVGASLLGGALPLTDAVVLLSGRASFELVQKAMVAGVPLVAAIGAPSTLAVDLALAAGITLIGFLREQSYNIYSHAWRVRRATGA